MAEISIRPIIPRGLNKSAYEKAMKSVLKEQTQVNKTKFKSVSDKFTTETVEYQQEAGTRQGALYRSVFTKSPRMAYLNYGTNVRWAVMSDDYSALTKVGSLRTQARGGKVLIRGRQAMIERGIQPKRNPGIEARKFDETIVKEEQKPFEKRANTAMAQAAKNTF